MPRPAEPRHARPDLRRPVPSETAPEAVSASLERVRRRLHRWLDQLESRFGALDESSGALDDELSRRRQELERRRAALDREAEDRDRQWEERLEALEHDRLLLAEAWQRLEKAQVSASGRSEGRASPEPGPAPTAPPAPPASSRPDRAASDRDPEIDRTVLRQFEALRRDVRNHAEARRSG